MCVQFVSVRAVLCACTDVAVYIGLIPGDAILVDTFPPAKP